METAVTERECMRLVHAETCERSESPLKRTRVEVSDDDLPKWACNRWVPWLSHTPTLCVGDSEFVTTEEKAWCLKTALFLLAPNTNLSDID